MQMRWLARPSKAGVAPAKAVRQQQQQQPLLPAGAIGVTGVVTGRVAGGPASPIGGATISSGTILGPGPATTLPIGGATEVQLGTAPAPAGEAGKAAAGPAGFASPVDLTAGFAALPSSPTAAGAGGALVTYSVAGRPGGRATRSGVPLALPASMIAKPPMKASIMNANFVGPSGMEHAPQVLGPGRLLAGAAGAVSAGPQFAPQGTKGALLGITASTLAGPLAPVVAPVTGGLGYAAGKAVARKQHTVGLYDTDGQTVVNVKLWKSGKHAPLTEEGYWLVASDPRDSEMELFIKRVIQSLRLHVAQPEALKMFVPWYSGSEEVQSLAAMRAELGRSGWLVRDGGVPVVAVNNATLSGAAEEFEC